MRSQSSRVASRRFVNIAASSLVCARRGCARRRCARRNVGSQHLGQACAALVSASMAGCRCRCRCRNGGRPGRDSRCASAGSTISARGWDARREATRQHVAARPRGRRRRTSRRAGRCSSRSRTGPTGSCRCPGTARISSRLLDRWLLLDHQDDDDLLERPDVVGRRGLAPVRSSGGPRRRTCRRRGACPGERP